MRYLIAVAALALSACAGPRWARSDGSQAREQDFDRDAADCEAQANSSGVYGGLIANRARVRLFRRCMSGRGWRAER